MKRFVTAGMVLVAVVAMAMPSVAEEKSIGLTLAQVQAERKALVEAAVAPAGEQTEKFWQTYWHYRGAVSFLNDRTIEVIEEFKDAEGALAGDSSAALVLEVLDIEKQRVALKQKYAKNFEGTLIPKQIVRWYQAERKMDSIIRADMALNIPFNSLSSGSSGELTEKAIRTDREALVNAIVQPSSEQEKPFWYDYRRYTKRSDELDKRITALVEVYVASNAALTDQQAKVMLKEATQIEVDRVKELERLVYSMRSVLTAKQMARLMQGELKMNAVIDLALAVAIPLDG